ncbi:sulfatase family protein [Pedobacter sp. MW01-1-1]|uniref:sulfatase family protein n=1 Tax=Pedobacter sp. MW01-1-1 TaxID=3383027 RepID=UPI003FF088DC
MNLKKVVKTFTFCLLVSCTAYAQKPNIVYILTDDMGYGDISALNKNSKIQTPHFDALVHSGMSFSDAHTNSAVCTPSRYGILTGRYAWRTNVQSGVLWSYDSLMITKNRTTVASLLKKEGYNTACIGKWHLGLGWQKDAAGKIDFNKQLTNGPTSIGFDYFYGITASLDIPPYFYIHNDKITATKIDTIKGTSGQGFWREGPIGNDFKHEEVLPRFGEKACEYIQTQAKADKPFFLYLPLPSPHTPMLPSKDFKGKSGLNDYTDFVLMTDDIVGKVLKAIKDAGIENNTLVILTSDNGVTPVSDIPTLTAKGHYSSYIYRGAKADIYEGGHRVPFVVKWPAQVKPNSKSDATICLTDFMATLAELNRQPLKDNEGEDSFSLLPLLLQKGNYTRKNIVLHSIDGNFAVREANWKLEYAYGSGGWSTPTEKEGKQNKLPNLQLYNLKNDIAEKDNLANKNPQEVEKLTRILESTINNGRSTPGKKQKNDVPVQYLKYQ